MPKMTVYIRNDDLDKWLALENKSEAISEMLRNNKQQIVNDMVNLEVDGSKYDRNRKDALAGLMAPACCLNSSVRCKHWEWDGLSQTYTNSNTGEIMEAQS